MQRSGDSCRCWVMIYVVYSCSCENMFLKIERQTIKKEKERYFWKKKLNIIEKKKKKSVIKYCIFFQFMYKNIKVSVTLTLTL